MSDLPILLMRRPHSLWIPLLLGLREVKEQYGSKYLKLQFEEV